jgi:predicted nucleotidyltransferase
MAEKIRRRSSLKEVRAILRRYWKALDEIICVDRMILFGSYARGDAHRDSDIDVVVVSRDFVGFRFEDSRTIMRSTIATDLRIEPHPFRPEDYHRDNPLAEGIIDTGIPIRRPASVGKRGRRKVTRKAGGMSREW